MLLAGGAQAQGVGAASAQPSADAAGRVAHPTLSLEASASRHVLEDTAWASFLVEREAKDQATAQRQAQAAFAEVLTQVRGHAHLHVSTEAMSTRPNYNKNEVIIGWRTSLMVRIESGEVGLVPKVASELMDKARLVNAGFFLSTAKQQEVEGELIDLAVKAFKQKASVTAKALGFASTSYKNVALQQPSVGGGMHGAMRVGMVATEAGDSAPLGMEPGRAEVTVTVSGEVNLLP